MSAEGEKKKKVPRHSAGRQHCRLRVLRFTLRVIETLFLVVLLNVTICRVHWAGAIFSGNYTSMEGSHSTIAIDLSLRYKECRQAWHGEHNLLQVT